MLEAVDNSVNRYGVLVESEEIVPEDYKIFDRKLGMHKDFYLIFTYSENILNKLPNAAFYRACAQVWVDENDISSDIYLNKSKNILMLSSKRLCVNYTRLVLT